MAMGRRVGVADMPIAKTPTVNRNQPDGNQVRGWWAHKGSNLGPLPCEGNALPLSYASGIFVCRSKASQIGLVSDDARRRSERFTKCGPPVSSCQR